MQDENIKKLLADADENFSPKTPASHKILRTVQSRAYKRRVIKTGTSIAAGICIVTALAIGYLINNESADGSNQPEIANIQARLKELQAKTDATLELIRQINEDQARRLRLLRLQAELAAIKDPLTEIRRHVEKTAYTLLYYAQKKYKHPGQRQSAITDYQRVIELYPETDAAQTARKRLSQIENKNLNEI